MRQLGYNIYGHWAQRKGVELWLEKAQVIIQPYPHLLQNFKAINIFAIKIDIFIKFSLHE